MSLDERSNAVAGDFAYEKIGAFPAGSKADPWCQGLRDGWCGDEEENCERLEGERIGAICLVADTVRMGFGRRRAGTFDPHC